MAREGPTGAARRAAWHLTAELHCLAPQARRHQKTEFCRVLHPVERLARAPVAPSPEPRVCWQYWCAPEQAAGLGAQHWATEHDARSRWRELDCFKHVVLHHGS